MDRQGSAITWTVTSSAPRVFLGQKLQSSNTQTDAFPLMRLPPELRERIYDLVLLIPRSGIRADTIDFVFEVFSREYDSTHQRSSYLHEFHDNEYPIDRIYFFSTMQTIKCRPLKTHLALLLVSTQVFQEATPVFYGGNHFACSTVGDLRRFLQSTLESRKDYIGHISFHLNNQDAKLARTTFELLKELKYLRDLDIWVSETEWGAVKTRRKPTKYSNILKILGLPTLRSIRGLKRVTFMATVKILKPIWVH